MEADQKLKTEIYDDYILTAEQDVNTVLDTMETILASLDDIISFSNSPLYEHLNFKKSNKK